MLFDLILFVLYMFYVVLMCVFDVCLLIVIMCGIMFVEVVDYGCVFFEVGFWIVEVLLNLLELFDSIVELCCVLFDDMIVGVGIVLCVEYVDCVQDVGGVLIVMLYSDVVVIGCVCECGLVSVLGVVMLIEVFVVLMNGVDVLKMFLVEQFGVSVVKVWCVVIDCVVLLILVGGIVLDNMWLFFDVGVNGFGFGLVLYCLGQFVDMIVVNVCVFQVGLCVVCGGVV